MTRAPKSTIASERPGPDAPEHDRAHWWRVHVAKLARPTLAERIGYSVAQIARMEEGEANGRPIPPEVYVAYRMACAAVSAGVRFDWLDTVIEVAPGVSVTKSAPAPSAADDA